MAYCLCKKSGECFFRYDIYVFIITAMHLFLKYDEIGISINAKTLLSVNIRFVLDFNFFFDIIDKECHCTRLRLQENKF